MQALVLLAGLWTDGSQGELGQDKAQHLLIHTV